MLFLNTSLYFTFIKALKHFFRLSVTSSNDQGAIIFIPIWLWSFPRTIIITTMCKKKWYWFSVRLKSFFQLKSFSIAANIYRALSSVVQEIMLITIYSLQLKVTERSHTNNHQNCYLKHLWRQTNMDMMVNSVFLIAISRH